MYTKKTAEHAGMAAKPASKNNKMFGAAALADFCDQLAVVASAGLPTGEGLGIIAGQNEKDENRALFLDMKDALEMGLPLYMVAGKTGAFPLYFTTMLEIGENSGKLEETLAALSEYYKRQAEFSNNLKSTLTYPLTMLVIIAAVITVLLTKIMPVFEEVYLQLGMGVNVAAQTAASFTRILNIVILAAAAVFFVICAVYFISLKNQKLKTFLLKKVSGIFGNENLFFKMAAAQFSRAMYTMLDSGMDIDSSFELAAQTVENPVYKNRIETCQALMRQGKGFAAAISESRLYTGMYEKMLHLGVKTGGSADAMKKIAKSIDEKIERQMNGFIAVIEPTLVAVLAVVVGVLLLSVMLPLVNIMSAMSI